MLHPCPSSFISIRWSHPWMTSTDGRVIHGWHSQMTLTSSMDFSSMDDISPSMDYIHGWHFSIHGSHFSIHGWHPRMALSFMDEVSPSMDGIFICQIFCENCHRNWLLFCKIDTKWMKTIDDGHGRSINDIFCPKVLARLS